MLVDAFARDSLARVACNGKETKRLRCSSPTPWKVSSLETEHVPLAGGICCYNTSDACWPSARRSAAKTKSA